ncbi:MAG: 1-acyl-sn-glycerol-3-phosphate acyltransferase, partial [Candidatus Poribacteria bacterium]|nr:1-acyl-sn-glycerol-3-phosphate acyltransferase [Candidatus Poribacteria bacterium]
RGSKTGALEAIHLMQERLRAGHSVASFPEAKTTDGTRVHAFHPRLFAAAIETKSTIQPVAIRYPHASGVNPIVPFVDNRNLVKHAFRIMSAKRTAVELTLCEPISSDGQPRKQLAQLARNSVADVFENSS